MHDNQRSDRRSRGGSRNRRPRSGGSGGGGSSRGHGESRGHHESRGGRSHSSGGAGSAPSRSQAPRPQSFWQKLIGFFTGKSKAAGRPSSSSSSSSATSSGRASGRNLSGSSRSAAEPSQNGHRRFESGEAGSSRASSRPQRKPELVEVSTPKLYVGNLSFDATEGDLFELFNGVGKVQNAEIVSNKYTQKSKGFAFVTMLTVEEARRAVTELHDKDFMGRKLVVSGAKTSDVSREIRASEAADTASRDEETQENTASAP